MKPYQTVGLSFLVYLFRNGMGGILGDEMGLGKTLQTLALLQHLKETTKVSSSGQGRPSLVICPLSVLNSWSTEARKFAPELKVLRFHGPERERGHLKRMALGEMPVARKVPKVDVNPKIIDLESEDELTRESYQGPDIIVTTYEGFLAEENWFKRALVWRYVVLDEGHKIKNELSLIAKALQGLGAEYRLVLTGTPLQNNLSELWALLHWLYPEVFTTRSQEIFKKSFNLTQGRVSTKVMDDSRRLLEHIMLRRTKSSPGVDLNLPPKTEVLLYCALSPMQKFWYMRLLTRTDQGLLDDLFQGAGSKEAALLQDEIENVDSLETSNIEQLSRIEAPSENTLQGAQWHESKAIMKQAIEREQADQAKNPAWRKLMNLLLQLRKVSQAKTHVTSAKAGANALVVLQPSLRLTSRRARTLHFRRPCNPCIREIHRARQNCRSACHQAKTENYHFLRLHENARLCRGLALSEGRQWDYIQIC